MNPAILQWKSSLERLYLFYTQNRPPLKYFYPGLFVFFIFVNTLCYWLAIFTAYPEAIRNEGLYYFKVQFPVGIMGALFDSLSFFVTIYIIKKSLRSSRSSSFIGHLSIDFVIAVLATFWVLFVFSFSGWLISLTEPVTEVLSERNSVYRGRVMNAVREPSKNLKNIYFGMVMGISAMLPTCLHVFMALRSLLKSRKKH